MRKTEARFQCFLLLLTGSLWAVSGAAQEESEALQSKGVIERLSATMESAARASPRPRLEASLLGGEVAELRSRAGAGAPVLSWQQEGLGAGFENRPNAARYLRLTLPVQSPWNREASRNLYETTEDLLLSGGRAHRLDAAVLAAEGWLELAAQTEHVVLVEERVRRLERALEVQSRRYELGEISGSERRQLELEGVRERASLDLAESRLLVARQQLESLAPGGVFPPAAGDLYRLLEALGAALPSEADLDSLLSESPYLRLAAHHRAVAAAEEKVLARNVWGSPEVELEWEHIPGLDGAAGLDAAGFRIGWPLPLGAQGRQRLAAAQQRVSAEAARSELLRRELGARLRSHWSTIRLGRAGLGGLEEAAAQIPETEHSLAEQFRLGAISYVVFLDGLARLDELRQGLIETRHRVLAAQLEMARLLGAEEFFPLPLEKGAGS